MEGIMFDYDTAGLGGSFVRTDRGQPMQMFSTDRPFYPLDPRPEDIHLADIAHSLSLICRYSGHCSTFYSVAQHSVLVSWQLEGTGLEREALLHDAAEAYLGDMIKPLKRIFPEYVEVEKNVERAIAERFGLIWPWPDEVKNADLVLLSTEKRDLMRPSDWGPLPDPLPQPINPWGPKASQKAFLARCAYLGIK